MPEIDNALAPMKPNDVSPVLTLPANRLVVAVLTDKHRARGRQRFDEVEGKVRDRILIERQVDGGRQDKAKEAARNSARGEDIEKVAKEIKLEVNSPARIRPRRFSGRAWDRPLM